MAEKKWSAGDSLWQKTAETMSAMTGIPATTLDQMRYDTESLDKTIAQTGNDPVQVRNSAVLASLPKSSPE